MDDNEIPIFKKTYELYKVCYSLRKTIPKQDRYALWQRCENAALNILEGVLLTKQSPKEQKIKPLEDVSVTLNTLRILFRLAKDIRCIDIKKYVVLQSMVDEIGRMLGGWIRSLKESSSTCPPLKGLRACCRKEKNTQTEGRLTFGFGLSSQLLLTFS